MPSKTDINPQTGKPYAVNPATGVWDDNYFATVVEPQFRGSSNSAGTTADQLIKTSIDKYTQLADQYTSKLSEYDQKNPFVFDKILEDQTAQVTNRLDPYYTQTLADFNNGIETKRTRSIEDRDKLLSELSQDTNTYTGNAKIALDAAMNKSREGFADAELYGSGQQLSGTGQIDAQGKRSLDQYMTGQERAAGNITTAANRTGQDLTTEQTKGVRDINTQKSYDVQSQSLAETLRQQNQREFERQQYAGIPPGVNGADYSSYVFGLLK